MEDELISIVVDEKQFLEIHLWNGNEHFIKLEFYGICIAIVVCVVGAFYSIIQQDIGIFLIFFLLSLILFFFANKGHAEFTKPMILKLDASNNQIVGSNFLFRSFNSTRYISNLKAIFVYQFSEKQQLCQLIKTIPYKELFVKSLRFKFDGKESSIQFQNIRGITIIEWFNLLTKVKTFFLDNGYSISIPDLEC